MAISPETNMVLSLLSLQSRINRRLDGALGIHGISFNEFSVMLRLSESPNLMLRRVELAECVGMTASGVTRLLAPMEKIGLVKKEKNARDARVSLVKLTSAGKKLFNDAEITINEASETLVCSLKGGQRVKFIEVIKSLA